MSTNSAEYSRKFFLRLYLPDVGLEVQPPASVGHRECPTLAISSLWLLLLTNQVLVVVLGKKYKYMCIFTAIPKIINICVFSL
jgi:hypothetical protein